MAYVTNNDGWAVEATNTIRVDAEGKVFVSPWDPMFHTKITAEWEESNVAYDLAEGQTHLYIVHIIASTVADDNSAYESYVVRADSDDEAKLKAILRHGVVEKELADYDFIVENKGIVSEVDADAE
jgi:hypothetical protein